MNKRAMSRSLFLVVIIALAVSSCKQEDTNVQLSESANSEILLQKEIDSLRLQLLLYKDTVIEQRERLEKIKKILEPLIQQDSYE